jgi:hypothetical protein
MLEDGSQKKEESQNREVKEHDSEEEAKENFDLLGARLNHTNNKETSSNGTQKALDDNCIAFSNTE